MAAAKKEETSGSVVFYLLGLNGEPKLKQTPIHYPYAVWTKGRIAAEDTVNEENNLEFIRGRLELASDDWRVEWMRVYNTGGTIMVDGKERKIKGDQSMFIITEEDPAQKIKVQQKIVKEIVEVKVIDRSFADMLTADQLESLAIGNGIDVSKYPNTKAGLITALEENGNIAK